MRQIAILILCFFFSMQLWAQENSAYDKITLNSGEVYVGEIVLRTPEIIMLRTKSGARFQFQLSDVKMLEKEIATEPIEPEADAEEDTMGNFAIVAELSGGTSQADNSFLWSPNTQFSMLLGNKMAFGQNLFIGVGVGYSISFASTHPEPISFLPLFVRVESTLSNKRTAPFAGFDTGYAFALNTDYNGGFLLKISAGVSHKLTYKTKILAGLFAGINTFSGKLTETYNSTQFSYYGQTRMNSAGVKIGLQF